MKIKNLLPMMLLLPFTMQAEDNHADDATSKTFFSVNPHYSTGRPEHLSLYRYQRMQERENGCGASFQIVGFGGKSTNSSDLARYFLPYQKSCLVIAESPDPNPVDGAFIGGSPSFKNDSYDLLARNFNIETEEHNFESRIAIRPKQSFGGAALNYSQMLSHCDNKGYWFDVTIPVVHVKNSVHLEEKVTSSSAPLPGTSANMRAAFMNPDWKYGKIAPCGHGKTAVGDAEMRFGLEIVNEGTCSYGGWLGFIIPGGNRPNARYMFEPVVGRNHHWGISWGSSTMFEVWENQCGTSNIRWYLDTNNYYLFQATERRSFDLRDKSWSRYMNLFADSTATTTIPGINVLTQKMKIKPQCTFQMNSAFTFDWGPHFQLEAGAQLYFRQAEQGKLCGGWQEGPAIAGTKSATATPATSMSNATMRMWDYDLINDDADMSALHVDPAANTPVYRTIKLADLNLQSALHPFTGGFTFYGTLGYQNNDANYPWFAAVGSGYQLGSDNTFMQRWSVWGKIGMSL